MNNPAILLALTILLFSSIPFALALLNNHLRTLYFYCYISILFFLGGTLTTVYSINLTEKINIPGGSLAYCAFMMTTILFVMLQRDLSTIKNVLKLVVGINIFVYLLFSLIAKSVKSPNEIGLTGVLAQLFSQSLLVMCVGMIFIVLELAFFLFAIEKIKKITTDTFSIAIVYVVVFILVIVFDGLSFQFLIPLLLDLPMQNLQSQLAVKLLLAALFSVPMILFLLVNKKKLGMYISEALDLTDLISPSRSKLLAEIEKHREIAELSVKDVRDLAARLSIATESFNLGVWELDLTTNKCIWNDKMYALHNVQPESFSHSLAEWQSFIVDDDLDSVTMEYQKVCQNKGDGSVTYRIKPVQKGVRWIESHFRILFDQELPVRLIGLNLDVTEKRQLKLIESNLKIKEFDSKKSDALKMLLGGIAHDFGNILQPLSGYAFEVLESQSLSHAEKKNLHRIIEACSRSENLLSRIISLLSNYAEERRPVKLQDIVRKACKKIVFPSGHSLLMKLDLDDECPPVLASPVHALEIVDQLCKNAVYAMREKGGELSISVSTEPGYTTSLDEKKQNSGIVMVKLCVTDEGEGIHADDIDKIFDPYYTTGHKRDGKGLGLTIVKNLVSSYHGIVEVRSEKDKATEVCVKLPAYTLLAR